jgi:hypothetical protein
VIASSKASEFTDLEIYIRPAKSAETDESSRHDVEAKINGSGLWRDEITLNEAALSEFEDQPKEYGERLAAQLLTGRIRTAFDQAVGTRGGNKVRLRILLDPKPDRRHLFRWERLFDKGPISTSPSTPLSRYLLSESIDPVIPDDGVFHLVIALANPSNLPQGLAPVDVLAELRTLALAFQQMSNLSLFRLVVMPGSIALDDPLKQSLAAIRARVVPGPVTLQSIKLEAQAADGLHIVSHGKFIRKDQKGYLYLEDDSGNMDRVEGERLSVLKTDNLKLVYLQACESGARADQRSSEAARELTMVGVAANLVEAGIQAVVAMQQPVEMEDAQVMTRAFYQSLMKDGTVDVAVNAGRQAVESRGGDRWSIPALYMRLKDGRLWYADPFREALRRQVAEWEQRHDMKTPVPLQATRDQHARHLAGGGTYDVTSLAAAQLKAGETRLILAGSRGSGKTAVLDRVAWSLAKEFLEQDGVLIPIRFDLKELAGFADLMPAVRQRLLTQAGYGQYDAGRPFQNRNLVLMVDGEEDVVPARRIDFLQAVMRLPANVRLMLTVDVLALDEWLMDRVHGLARQKPSILRMQPMERAVVMRYLNELEFQKHAGAEAAHKRPETLAQKIQRNRWWDLTSEAWMLRRMIRYEEAGLRNRAELFGRVTAEQLGRLRQGNVTLTCAEQVLAAIAWELQRSQEPALPGGPLYELLGQARRGRDFPLTEIKTALVDDCEILRRSGEDGVRFAYAGFQAYYAALYLLRAPDRERKLDDIVATLGSARHLRLWEETLVLLAGLMDDFGPVLARVLAGSSSASGDQVYLAARCYLEVPESRRNKSLRELLSLLVDTLIWRSHPNNDRPIVDRKKAIKWLTEIETGDPPEKDRAIEHLVKLACDKMSRDWRGNTRFEFSGIRIEALNVMMARRPAVAKYVLAERPDLAELLNASAELIDHGDPHRMIHLMKRGKPQESPLAVFALGLSGHRDVIEILADVNRGTEVDVEVLWAIAEMLPRLCPQQTLDLAIRPLLSEPPRSRVVYMINKVGRAEKDTCEYLDRALHSGEPRVIGRAIRTLADLGNPRMRKPCELMVQARWDELRATGRVALPTDPTSDEAQSLQHAALEGLRSIGDRGTIAILQKAWLNLSPVLSHLSYDVAESIYWRLSEQKNRKIRQSERGTHAIPTHSGIR